MGKAPAGTLLRHLRGLALPGAGQLPDRELLQRFASDRDGAAFEELVRRHGPMVLRVCRRILREEHDAEDAFQATFLVLARKAAGISAGATVAGWLYRVAYRIALRARSATR